MFFERTIAAKLVLFSSISLKCLSEIFKVTFYLDLNFKLLNAVKHPHHDWLFVSHLFTLKGDYTLTKSGFSLAIRARPATK